MLVYDGNATELGILERLEFPEKDKNGFYLPTRFQVLLVSYQRMYQSIETLKVSAF